ncbi:MAG: PilZ domain-containing protein [Planctomycetes bacterium]|nr:PilZ domain-containing protein [Planctomycetota bacterium]
MVDAHTTANQRREPRVPLDATVTVEVPATEIQGSGENISSQGVFFTAAGRLQVVVHIGGHGRTVAGELVRCETMGDGRVGIAIRFLEPLADA